MPAKSEAQRRLFAVARRLKESGQTGGNTPAARIARTVSKTKIREFTKKESTNRLARLIG